MEKRFVLFSLVLGIVFFLLSAMGSADAGRKVRVGFYYWPGFNNVQTDGTLSGYGYDYLREIQKYVDWEYEFITVPPGDAAAQLSYADSLALLLRGDVDIVGSVPKTAAPADLYAYPNLPASKGYGVLAVRAEAENYQRSVPASFEQMRVGVLAGSSRNSACQEFFQDRGVNIQVVEFAGLQAAEQALHEAKSIDGIFSNVRSQANEQEVLRLQPEDAYFVTRQNEPELLRELNEAQAQIQLHTPYFQGQLNEKYYAAAKRASVILTPEERAYIKAHPILRVGVPGNDPPFVFAGNKSQRNQGILIDIMKKIGEETGLQIEFIRLTAGGDAGAANMKKKDIAVLAAAVADYTWADERNLDITTAYLSLPLSAVANNEASDLWNSARVVALPESLDYIAKLIREKYHYENIVFYPTTSDAVDAVKRGTAELTFMPLYKAEMFARNPQFRDITVYSNTGISYGLSLGVSKAADPVLFHLLNKAVANLPQAVVAQIVADQSLLYTADDSLINIAYRHPFGFAGGVLAAFALGYRSWQKRRRVENELEFSEARFRVAALQGHLAVWDYDMEKKQIKQSLAAPELAGLGEIIANVPERIVEAGYLHPNSEAAYCDMYQKLFAGEKSASGVFRFRRSDEAGKLLEGYRWYKINYTVVADHAGKPSRAVGVSEDVTAEKNAEMEVLNSKKYQAITLGNVLAKYEVDVTEGLLLSVETNARAQFNDCDNCWDNVLRNRITNAVYPEHQQHLFDMICRENLVHSYQQGRYEIQSEVLVKNLNTLDYYWATINVYLINETRTEHIYANIYLRNTDTQKRQELVLKKAAERDPLTAVYNRKVMQRLITAELGNKGVGKNGYLLLLDIDDFKQVNDQFGHSVGDAVLVEFGRCLLQVVSRKNDVVGRLGGDEFMVFLGGDTTMDGVRSVVEKISLALSQKSAARSDIPGISCSMGIAYSPEHGNTFKELYHKADIALYMAKKAGKNQHYIYSEEITAP